MAFLAACVDALSSEEPISPGEAEGKQAAGAETGGKREKPEPKKGKKGIKGSPAERRKEPEKVETE